eukprot:TRINITY_DN17919_c0_g1_i1.p1 TRINITY_DN17919_c0_g1~~TRINITY_DN17919_c0_g1_i1.p1  ORF type:complete len:928 (-),score=185.10 TRINITY_DN17919_c0_g1_i1:63-2846(-)
MVQEQRGREESLGSALCAQVPRGSPGVGEGADRFCMDADGVCVVIQDALESLAVRLLAQLRKLYEESKLTDVELIAGEGVDRETFSVHRVVLACASDYFKALFDGPFAEAADTRATLQVRLPDCPAKSVKAFLDFVYSGRTVVKRAELFSTYCIAKRLQCETLAHEIMHLWKVSMHEDNVVVLLNTCFACEMSEARSVLLKWADEHFADLVESDDFPNLDPAALIEILRSDRLLVDSEEVVLDAVLRWLVARFGHESTSPAASPRPRSKELRTAPESPGRPAPLVADDETPLQVGATLLRHVRWAQLADLVNIPRRLEVRRLAPPLLRELERLVEEAAVLTGQLRARAESAAGSVGAFRASFGGAASSATPAAGRGARRLGGKGKGKKSVRAPFPQSASSVPVAAVPKEQSEQAGWLRQRAYCEEGGRFAGIWDPGTTEPLLFLTKDHAVAPLLCLVDVPDAFPSSPSGGASPSRGGNLGNAALREASPSSGSPTTSRRRSVGGGGGGGGRCLVQAFRDLHVLSLETWAMVTTLVPPPYVPDVVCSAIVAVGSRLLVAAFNSELCVWRSGGSWDLVGVVALRERISSLAFAPQLTTLPLLSGCAAGDLGSMSGLLVGSMAGYLDLFLLEPEEGPSLDGAASPTAGGAGNRRDGSRSSSASPQRRGFSWSGNGGAAAVSGDLELPLPPQMWPRPWGDNGITVGNDKVETMLLFGPFLLTAAEQLTVWRIEASPGGANGQRPRRRRGSPLAAAQQPPSTPASRADGHEVGLLLSQHIASNGMVSSLERVGERTVAAGTERGVVMIIVGPGKGTGSPEGSPPFALAFELQVFPSEITALFCQSPNELIVAGNDWNPEEGTYNVCDTIKVFSLENDETRSGRGQVRSALRLRGEYRDQNVDGFRSLAVAGRKLVAVVAHNEDRFSVKVYDS